jgi:predicted dehydrogenase
VRPGRACVLGQGSIGRRHAGLLLERGLEVTAFDPAGTVLDGVRSAAGEAEALAGADIAIVASPSSEHARHARLALEAGVPVLVEKPLALDAADARALEALADRLGVPLGVGMNLRFHPGVRGVGELLPRVGRVWRAAAWCGSWLPGWRPGTDYRRSYSARSELGGGVLLDAIHEIDYLCALLGPVATVSAELPRVSDLEIDVEDVALLRLGMRSGARATITLDYLDRAYHRGCRIVGEDGTVAWEWDTGEVLLLDGDGTGERIAAPPDAAPTYAAEQDAFLEAIAGGGPVPVSAAAGRHALEVVDAARSSAAAGGRTVPVADGAAS